MSVLYKWLAGAGVVFALALAIYIQTLRLDSAQSELRMADAVNAGWADAYDKAQAQSAVRIKALETEAIAEKHRNQKRLNAGTINAQADNTTAFCDSPGIRRLIDELWGPDEGATTDRGTD